MSLLHKTKNEERNNDPLIRLMMPMIAGVLACVFCLVSMTWAWFTASVDTPTQTLQSASRSTSVKVYEVSRATGEGDEVAKTLVEPKTSETLSLAEGEGADDDENVIISGEPVVWELSSEKSYEVVLTGEGDASKGYCKVALYHNVIENDEITPKTEMYNTEVFGNKETFSFTYNTGGFNEQNGLTATQWKEYVEKADPPTLTIASCWGKPAEDEAEQVSMMSLRDTSKQIMLLSDGDVLGLAPIPCPEAKAETEVELEGFETEAGAVISAEEDYKISLTLKEGYEMPSEVVVNIDGTDYVVSTVGSEASDDAPYYDAESGVLTVPSALLSDGVKVSVKATATLIPEEEPEEEETEEEATEETTEEETEETTDNGETEEDTSADTKSDDTVVADDPTKKEEDDEKDSVKPNRAPTGNSGNDDDDDDQTDNNSGDSSNDNASFSEDETEDEKADVTLNLSQLTINLEETQIPTNADLVLTLSAKEDMKLPEKIVITLDKTIRDENIDNEEIKEDKTEYIINTDGKDNPEGFEFDVESGELTISSELLEGVREITIADTEENEADENEDKATLTFEVKNLTFDFTDDEIVTDEDIVITFTAGEGYELPETIIITIDGKEYIIYTSAEDSDKNPEGITFDTETGTLTISKDLLEDAEAITITAEGIKKEDEESEASGDKDDTDNENEAEGGETTDKEPESETGAPEAEDKTETEGKPDVEDGEKDETTNPETDPDDTTEGETEPPEPDTEPTNPTTPDAEDNTDSEQGSESGETEENGEGSTENGTEETTPDTESSGDGETTTPTEPTTPSEPSEPVVTPETQKTEAPDTSDNTSSDPASSIPTPNTNSNSNGASQTSDTITSSGSKETSSEE